jgi:predicted flap endonuclease-1-like 5' DNA nuclease
MTDITVIEGIGPAYAEKLAAANVTTCEGLLEQGATAKGRKAIIDASGLSEKLVLKWVNHADLCRIKGVGGEFAELLEAAGVDTVPELAQRNAENLAAKMAEVNAEKSLTRQTPSATRVAEWVAQAKELPRVITH